MKKPLTGPIWCKSAKVDLINAKNEVKYTIVGEKRGNLVYFMADFASKEPLSQRHFDENDEIIAILPPQTYSGKFGPGVILT